MDVKYFMIFYSVIIYRSIMIHVKYSIIIIL